MKIWIPYIAAGSGSDISTHYLAAGLKKFGCEVIIQSFNRYFEFAPGILKRVTPPADTDIILTNSWNGFAFMRPGARMVTVDRLFVLDPALEPYKSKLQRYYHHSLVRHFVRQSLNHADAVVAVSHYTADILARTLHCSRPHVIVNAVDTDFFSPPPSNKKPLLNRPVRLLYVGNLSARKGTDLLAPIARGLASGYELRYTSGLRPAKNFKNNPPNLLPIGSLNQEEVREAYRQADLLIFPSRGEGLPRAVMEAMACGTHVVAANVSSLPEAVSNHVGRLCPVDDVMSFVNAIHELTQDPIALHNMSMNARSHAEQHFNLNRMIEEYIVLFEQVLQKSKNS